MDLYYLMDLTWSMKDDKETLVGLGSRMANTLGTFTRYFRLGFGSYADKPLMPYIFPGHEKNPCKSEHAFCTPLYSFWHHLELTDNIPRFIQEVCFSDIKSEREREREEINKETKLYLYIFDFI